MVLGVVEVVLGTPVIIHLVKMEETVFQQAPINTCAAAWKDTGIFTLFLLSHKVDCRFFFKEFKMRHPYVILIFQW